MPDTVALKQKRGRAGGWLAPQLGPAVPAARGRRLHGAGLALLLPGEPPEHLRRLHVDPAAGSRRDLRHHHRRDRPVRGLRHGLQHGHLRQVHRPAAGRRPAAARRHRPGRADLPRHRPDPGLRQRDAGGQAEGPAVPGHLRHVRHRLRRRRDHLQEHADHRAGRDGVRRQRVLLLHRAGEAVLVPRAAAEPVAPGAAQHDHADPDHHRDRLRGRRHLRLRAAAHAVRPAHLRHRRQRGRGRPGGHQRAAPPHLGLHDLLVLRRRSPGSCSCCATSRARRTRAAPS